MSSHRQKLQLWLCQHIHAPSRWRFCSFIISDGSAPDIQTRNQRRSASIRHLKFCITSYLFTQNCFNAVSSPWSIKKKKNAGLQESCYWRTCLHLALVGNPWNDINSHSEFHLCRRPGLPAVYEKGMQLRRRPWQHWLPVSRCHTVLWARSPLNSSSEEPSVSSLSGSASQRLAEWPPALCGQDPAKR